MVKKKYNLIDGKFLMGIPSWNIISSLHKKSLTYCHSAKNTVNNLVKSGNRLPKVTKWESHYGIENRD